MSFEKKEWNRGDTIAAEDLNRMEDGIESASSGVTEPLIVTSNYDESVDDDVLDHTWQEIYNAFVGGRNVLLVTTNHPIRVLLVTEVREQLVSPERTNFRVEFGETSSYVATSADGYPVGGGA